MCRKITSGINVNTKWFNSLVLIYEGNFLSGSIRLRKRIFPLVQPLSLGFFLRISVEWIMCIKMMACCADGVDEDRGLEVPAMNL